MEINENIFGIIKTGGKQYKVKVGDILKVEKLSQKNSPAGEKVEFEDILNGRKVIAKIQSQGRLPKVRILKFKPKKRYKKVMGHKQKYTQIEIEKIS